MSVDMERIGRLLAEKKLKEAEAKVRELETSLRIAAGLISTMKCHEHKHPGVIYQWLLKEGE